MFSMTLLTKVLLFLFGAPHKVMYTAATFTAVNLILDFFRKYEPPKTKKEIFRDFLKRLLAYIAFIVIGTRVDGLAVDALFGWEGSTQFLVCLYIVAREIRVILDYIRQQGIDIPLILDNRIGQMERSETQGGFAPMSMTQADVDPAQIDVKIQNLKAQIDALKKANEEQNTTGGEHK